MFDEQTPSLEKIIKLLRDEHPELTDEELKATAERYFELAKFFFGIWLKGIEKSSKDPPT